jgi:hypothetical protein
MESDAERDALVREVLRINQRFNTEVIEVNNICPYARGARKGGRVDRRVLLQRDSEIDAALAAITAVEAGPQDVEVALLIFPCMDVTPREFEHFNQRLRAASTERSGGRPPFVHAVFHPDFPCDRRSPDALVSFFRKSPDPTIQLVRYASLEDIRGEQGRGTLVVDVTRIDWSKLHELVQPSVTDRITQANHAFVSEHGPEILEQLYEAIREDRARSYARFAALGVRGTPGAAAGSAA